jgi:hypothetical protein
MAADCSQNTDPLKLVREGTGQDGRAPGALDPAYAPADERSVADRMVFAKSYAALLKYFDQNNAPAGDWAPFFSRDVSVLLAAAAIEDVDAYKTGAQAWFDYLNELENQLKENELKDRLGFLYGAVASLALQLDALRQALPADVQLRGGLQNLIQTQLAPAFKQLIAYYKAGMGISGGLIHTVAPPVQILRSPAVSFDSVLNPGTSTTLAGDWSAGLAWATYAATIAPDASVYGSLPTVFEQINHCSTHTLFKSIFDRFLKVFARVTADAETALEDTLKSRDTHEPHYALFLAFLRLFEYARAAGNTLTQRHMDFYYRVILGLKEKSAEPAHVHLLAQLARQTVSRDFVPGELFKAGKDELGKDAFFANGQDFVANQAQVAALQNLYRHGTEQVGSSPLQQGRLFASPVANSDDGLGAPLASADGSWHPFFNKIYVDGALAEIRMPKADIGFAIASHYLLMAQGSRRITAIINVSGFTGETLKTSGKSFEEIDLANDIRCLLTTEKGWLEIKQPELYFVPINLNTIELYIQIDGGAPPIVPYSAKVHGYALQTDRPVLLVKLRQDGARPYRYAAFQDAVVENINFAVEVDGLKSLAVSNDFGPVDPSKPFQPFGAAPVSGSSLIIGSKEIFQKALRELRVDMSWLTAPVKFPSGSTLPTVELDFLSAGTWTPTSNTARSVDNVSYDLVNDLDVPVQDEPDFTANEFYGTQSRYGFVRLRLNGDFGRDAYQTALIHFLRKDTVAGSNPAVASPDPGSTPPAGPVAAALSVAYSTAAAVLALNTSDQDSYDNRPGQFFHLTPFGAAERHPYLQADPDVCLFPQFQFKRGPDTLASEAEFYVGITGLVPPQNLSLLFQVADGTANPLVQKPVPHIDWSYLKRNEWIEFDRGDVQDATDDLLNSGIVTLAVPRDATNDNTALPTGMFWIRAAVHEMSDAVCRLRLVAAQAMEAVFTDRGNAPSFSATPLAAGTISKLATPDSAVKSLTQPFSSFGGRGAEQSQAFYTRVSERLRHKNRGIDLWDYERLVLEAFPGIYQVKCLNHTQYERTDSGAGVYRELAPGHVTLVTIPNLQVQNFRDPLKPYTSLGLLEEIKAFLRGRTSCFAQLHVMNPQFEAVRLRFSVRLRPGFDETYYSNQLRQAITRFLAPWAFAGGGKPTFGGKVYKSVLLNFVEDQPYVDYVTDFSMFQDTNAAPGSVDLDEAQGSLAVSILTSAPASKHEITVIKPVQDVPLGESCACDA